MKTTIEIDDYLLVEAKKFAAEHRITLRKLIEQGVKQQLAAARARKKAQRRFKVKWKTAPGGLPPGLDLQDRTSMYEWIERSG